MPKVRITVLKRTLQTDVVDQEIEDEAFKRQFGRCSIFEDGQTFASEDWPNMPSGFCERAWPDIRHEVAMVMYKAIAPCSNFHDGQEFIIDGPLPVKPEGFCDGAWCDIQKHLYIVAFGGTFESTDPPGICYACCTDGLRPVTFKIEPLEVA